MSTVSEQYFLDYCKARRYKVKRITLKDKAGRFPDYETYAFAATLEKEGKASFDNRSIGRRVRKAIIDSAPQLRRYKDTPLPEILLLYDNLATGSYGGIIDYLDPMNVGAGMFGEPVIRFWRDPSLKPAEAPDATHGGGRQLTETTRLYIGALGVMKVDSADEIRIDFFHNPFSAKPVWPRYFLHQSDRHYVKPDHPNNAAWAWDEFVGDRTST